MKEERNSEYGDRLLEITQSEEQRGKMIEDNKWTESQKSLNNPSIPDLCNGVPERKKWDKETGRKNIWRNHCQKLPKFDEKH